MDINNFWALPGMEDNEFQFVGHLLQNLNDYQQQQFFNIYRSRRKDPQSILLLSLLGLVVVAGVHRFVLDQIGMGILYLFTGGLCLVGTIVDAVNYKSLAWEYNQKKAVESANMAKSFQIPANPGR